MVPDRTASSTVHEGAGLLQHGAPGGTSPVPQARRNWLRHAMLFPLAWPALMHPGSATAQPAPPRPGNDYRVLTTPQPAPADRIQVLEFFYYGCPFCAQLEPLLVDWLARQPPDVVFDRIPVVARDSWVPLAKLYYTLAEFGAFERMHAATFRAVHVESVQLGQFEVARDWAARSGIDRERFADTWRSSKVESLVDRARLLTDDYDIQSTPSLVVDGRLLTSSGLTGGVPTLLPMVDRLIAMIRAGRIGTAKP